jgi:hypothetical protein
MLRIGGCSREFGPRLNPPEYSDELLLHLAAGFFVFAACAFNRLAAALPAGAGPATHTAAAVAASARLTAAGLAAVLAGTRVGWFVHWWCVCGWLLCCAGAFVP